MRRDRSSTTKRLRPRSILPRPGTLGPLLLLPLVLAGCADTVVLSNDSGNEHGLLVDGNTSGSDASDQTFVSAATNIGVGSQSAAASSNEVVAFTNRRPVAIETPVPWTSGADAVNLPFNDEIVIPVKVWIVKGPFASQQTRAIDACVTTSSIWNSERMGVRFGPFEIVDATADPDAPTYYAFTCALKNGIESDIGKTAGRINVYYVDTVDGGSGRGQACQIGSDFVAMGSATNDELLVHEFGHDFGLLHIDGQATFDQTNILHSASSSRQFITEAQLFRAHLLPSSALNFLYGARPGEPTRVCGHNADTPECPRINKRIWADGAFPAN